MKRILLVFLLGAAAGAGGYWYFTEHVSQFDLWQAKRKVTDTAESATETIKEKVAEIPSEKIREELTHAGVVVREKARQAGNVFADAAANARTTASIKGKLIAEPGLSALSINVDTTDGLVTLSGTAANHEQIAKAVRLALETDGVIKVISTLQVKPAK